MSVSLSPVRPARRRATFHPLRVSALDRLTDEAVSVELAVPDELSTEFAFEPGQHLTLRAEIDGADVRRSYSICLSRRQAREGRRLRVATALVAGGVMSTWLTRDVRVGDTVDVMTPMGGFTCPVRPEQTRHHVALAGGSGITPVLSLVRTVLEEEPGSRVTLVFANRRADTVMFLEELADLKNAYPQRFQLLHVLSREGQEAELLSGRLDRERLERLLDSLVATDGVPAVDEWYLCGPFGLVETAREVLAERGADEAHVHHEVFHVDELGASVPPVTGPPDGGAPVSEEGPPSATTVTVTLDGRTTTIPMPSRQETLLAATLRERPDAPYSCTGGVCGTCRARLVDGEVTMNRTYALEPDEIARGTILACQSHPTTDRVVVDYDT